VVNFSIDSEKVVDDSSVDNRVLWSDVIVVDSITPVVPSSKYMQSNVSGEYDY